MHKAVGSLRAGRLDLPTLALLLLPAFLLLLANRAGLIGLYNDDAIYGVAARVLAEGGDPSQRDATSFAPLARFPIGFPFLLSLLWNAGGRDLGVVPLWELAVTIFTYAFLFGSYLLVTRCWGVSRLGSALAVLVVAYHPTTIKYGAAVMSDLPAAALALACLGLFEWARRRPGKALPVACAGAAFGLALLVRYAAVAPLAACTIALLWARRPRAALALPAVAGLVTAPWVVWVVTRRLYGYADQFLHNAPDLPVLQSLRDASWLLFSHTLPGFLAPGVFFEGIETLDAPGVADVGLRSLIGAGIAAWLLLACLAGLRRDERRTPALVAILTLVMVWLWAGRFPELSWDLQARMLLPVAPILLAGAFEGAAHQVAALPAWRRGSLVLAGVAFLGLTASQFSRIDRLFIENSGKLVDFHLRGLLSAKAYVDRLPAAVRVGAYYPFQVFFYLGRPIEPVEPTVAGLLKARDRGVRVIVAMPRYVGTHDQMFQVVKTLLDARPPRATVLYAASELMAVVHLPADPARPPEAR